MAPSDGRTHPDPASPILRRRELLVAVAAMIALFAVSRENYLLFHALAELFAIAAAWSVFLVVSSARRFLQNDALALLGTAYLFIGFLDLLHTLAYKGMGVFPELAGADPATQLWIAGRSMEAASLLLFAFFIDRRVRRLPTVSIYAGATALLVGSILIWDVFPICYDVETGLTAFKKISEYAICLVLGAALWLLRRRKGRIDPFLGRFMSASLILTIGAELAFTLYADVYGIFNLLGHFLKIASYWLVYRALVQSAMERPYALLYRDLADSERRLRALMTNLPGVAYRCKHAHTARRPMEFVSDGVFPLTGYWPEEIAAAGPVAYGTLIHPDDAPKVAEEAERAVRENRPFEVEYRIRTRAGDQRWVWERGRAVSPAPDGQLMLEGFITDITEKRTLQTLLLDASVREQKRLGQELHDGLCQDLKSLEIEMALMEDRLSDRNAVEAADAAGAGRRANQALRTACAMAKGMLPVGVDASGLGAALTELGERVRGRRGVRPALDIELDLAPADASAAHHLFRIAQEAVINALRHAEADEIAIFWRRENGRACLTIRDNGRGLPVDDRNRGGLGMLIMRLRAEAVGADLQMLSLPGSGVEVRCACPE